MPQRPLHEAPARSRRLPRAPGQRGAVAMAALLGVAGVAHFAATDTYALIVPRALPAPRVLVLVSGVVELGCAVLIAVPRTRRVGAWCALGLFTAVWPANLQMALDGGIPNRTGLLGSPVAAWLRLPLQLPLLYWAYRLTGADAPRHGRSRPSG